MACVIAKKAPSSPRFVFLKPKNESRALVGAFCLCNQPEMHRLDLLAMSEVKDDAGGVTEGVLISVGLGKEVSKSS